MSGFKGSGSGNGLPDGASEGQVLTADAQGDPIWADAASGVSAPTIPAFTDLTDQVPGDVIESAAVTVTGDTETVWPATVRGDGSPQMQVAGGAWVRSDMIRAGDSVALRLTSASAAVTARTATLYAQGVSAPWVVTTQDVAWLPSMMANAAHWWDFSDTGSRTDDDTHISTQADRIGSADLIATGSASLQTSAQNGLDAWQAFDDAGVYFTTALGTTPAPFAVATLVRFDHATQPSGNYDYFHSLGDSGTVFNGGRWNGDNRFYNFNGSTTRYGPAMASGWRIVLHWMETSAPFHRLRIDGADVTVEDYSAASVNGNLALGIFNSAKSHPLNGAIGESHVVRGAWTGDEREKLEGYLAHKWGLAANLPADHPYKSSAP